MRKFHRFPFLAVAFALTLAVAGRLSADEEAADRWAILIGVDDYVQAQDLQFAGADQRALRERLVAAGFPERHAYLLHNKAENYALASN